MKKVFLALTLGLFATGTAFADNHGKMKANGVDASKSQIKWTGYGVGKSHWGHVSLTKADIQMKEGKPVAGEIVVDLKTIQTKDLEDPKWAGKLNGHLMSEDFFDVEKFPTAKFVATSIEEQKDHSYKVKGKFTVKGKTVDQEVVLTKKDDKLLGTLSFDRTNFGVMYNAKETFSLEALAGAAKDKVIKDNIDLEISLALN